jgi:hypothetical protein
MILYVYFRDNIYRLQLSATSMFPYGDYQEQFRDSHVSLVETELGTVEGQKSDSSPLYFTATFRQAAPFDYDKAFGLIKDLGEALKLYEQSRDLKKDMSSREVDEVFVDTTDHSEDQGTYAQHLDEIKRDF